MLGSDHPVLLDVVGGYGILAVVVELLLYAPTILPASSLHALHFSQEVTCPLGKRFLGSRGVLPERRGGGVVDDPLQKLLFLSQEGFIIVGGGGRQAVEGTPLGSLRGSSDDLEHSVVAAKGKELHLA